MGALQPGSFYYYSATFKIHSNTEDQARQLKPMTLGLRRQKRVTARVRGQPGIQSTEITEITH